MKIALFQINLFWENTTKNLDNIINKINSLSNDVNLVVLPEMFTSGFSMNAQDIAETLNGKTIKLLKETAKNKNIAITGSLAIKENNNFYNCLAFIYPDGSLKTYYKRHLFSLAGEDKIYTKGLEKVIIEYNNWKFCPLICYDLRFPVFSRNTENYDILLYVANWPTTRINAWDTLLKARAIENMCYTIGVNRVGEDQNNNFYNGHSQAIDALGNYVLEPQEQEDVYYVKLNKEHLLNTRSKFGFLNDKDNFMLV